MESTSTRQANTLENLLYQVRDRVGGIKDDIFESIVSTPPPRTLENYNLISYLPCELLQEKQSELVKIMGEIKKDELILEYLSPDARQDLWTELVVPIEDYITELDYRLDLKGLLQLSKFGKQLYERLKPIADKTKDLDRKTKLYIEDHFKASLKEHIEQHLNVESSASFAIAVMDLNNLKKFNDQFSHEHGTEVIKQFARLMKEYIPGVLARSSEAGDEFYVLMPGADEEGLKGLIDSNFLKEVDSRLGENVVASWERKGNECDEMFEKLCNRLTCAVGTSSPCNGEPLLKKVCNKINGANNGYGVLKQKLAEGLQSGLPEYKIYKSLDGHLKELLLDKAVDVLIDEADTAMYVAKKQAKEAQVQGQKTSKSLAYMLGMIKEKAAA